VCSTAELIARCAPIATGGAGIQAAAGNGSLSAAISHNVIPAQAGTQPAEYLLIAVAVRNCAAATHIAPMPHREKCPCVYILASRRNGTLYIRVTSDLAQRVNLHKQGLIAGFTKKYGVHRLVYYEMHPAMDAAIRREKQLKEWRRLWKIRLIESMNPEWIDLFDGTTGEILNGPADRSRSTH
jgi:putative endonuclease